jgi:hypothetical protein
VATVARLTSAVLKHVDLDHISAEDFAELAETLYELAALWTNPQCTGPSLRSAVRVGFYAGQDARKAALT